MSERKSYDTFEDFHADNPEVYSLLVRLARTLRVRGYNKFSITLIYEMARWTKMMETTDGEYKLNNNWKPNYARLIMEQEPDLQGVFDLRSKAEAKKKTPKIGPQDYAAGMHL